MRLFGNLEIPWPVTSNAPAAPPRRGPDDNRNTDDVTARPFTRIYDPNALDYPNTMLPPVPGDGGYRTAGLGQVQVSTGQWDRSETALAGPVRSFFLAQFRDNRMKGL